MKGLAMFGWIKRRLLARKCRKALQSVESYRSARARIAGARRDAVLGAVKPSSSAFAGNSNDRA